MQSVDGVGCLVGRAYFDPEDPVAQNCAGKVKRGILRACSARWIPGGCVRRGALDPTDPWYLPAEDDDCGDAAEGYVMGTPSEPNHLLEASMVSVPADPRAIATGRMVGGAERALSGILRGQPAAAGDLDKLLSVLGQDPRVVRWAGRLIDSRIRASQPREITLSELFGGSNA